MTSTTDCLVRVICGKLGSGKTWVGVMKAMEALCRGEVVVSNVRFNWPEVERYCARFGVKGIPRSNYRFFETSSMSAGVDGLLSILTRGSFLLFDEAHLLLDARNWRENARLSEQFQLLITQARKLKIDMVFVTQAYENLEGRVTRQATEIIRVTNWRHVPIFGNWLPFPVTLVRYCLPDGRTVQAKDWIWRKKNVGQLYDSSQTFCGLEVTGAPPAPVLGARKRAMGWGFRFVVLGCIIAGLGFLWPADETRVLPGGPSAPAVASKPPPASSGSSPAPLPPAVLTRGQVAMVETRLPSLRRVTPSVLHLADGSELRRGFPFLNGYVLGWRVFAGFVSVNLDSDTIPTVNLYENGRKPILSADDGSSGGPAGGALAGGAAAPDALPVQPVQGTLNASPARFEPPKPFIPESSGPRYDWIGSTRLPNSREDWSSGRLSYEN